MGVPLYFPDISTLRRSDIHTIFSFVYSIAYALNPSSVSCKSFACYSYENCRV
jgi:hypothetical protein